MFTKTLVMHYVRPDVYVLSQFSKLGVFSSDQQLLPQFGFIGPPLIPGQSLTINLTNEIL